MLKRQTQVVATLPDELSSRPYAWIGYKPTAYKATSQVFVVFENGVRLRLPMVGHRPDWFRYRRVPPGALHAGRNTIRLVFESTPGSLDPEGQVFFGFHLLLTRPAIPSGPELFAWSLE